MVQSSPLKLKNFSLNFSTVRSFIMYLRIVPLGWKMLIVEPLTAGQNLESMWVPGDRHLVKAGSCATHLFFIWKLNFHQSPCNPSLDQTSPQAKRHKSSLHVTSLHFHYQLKGKHVDKIYYLCILNLFCVFLFQKSIFLTNLMSNISWHNIFVFHPSWCHLH